MTIRHIHKGKVYEIELPFGSRAKHLELAGESAVWVPDEDYSERFLPDTPSCLIADFAKEGRYGLKLLSVRRCRLPH